MAKHRLAGGVFLCVPSTGDLRSMPTSLLLAAKPHDGMAYGRKHRRHKKQAGLLGTTGLAIPWRGGQEPQKFASSGSAAITASAPSPFDALEVKMK